MASSLIPITINVPVKDGKTSVAYDLLYDKESGLDVDLQSGDMRTREQTIELVQAVYNVGAESMADELERYNRWVRDPDNKAKASKLTTKRSAVAEAKELHKQQYPQQQHRTYSHHDGGAAAASVVMMTPQAALEKAAECRKRGNDWLLGKDYRKAHKAYSEGLAYLNVSQRCGLLLSNRAEALLKMGRYDEAATGAAEAMRRFEIQDATAATIASSQRAAANDNNNNNNKNSGAGSSTMEVLDDDDDDDSVDDDDDGVGEQDLYSNVALESLLGEQAKVVVDEAKKNATVRLRRLEGTVPVAEAFVDPMMVVSSSSSSSTDAAVNLRSLWAKAAFRLVRAFEGSDQPWHALSVAHGVIRKFEHSSSNDAKKSPLANVEDWKQAVQRAASKLLMSTHTKITLLPEDILLLQSQQKQQQTAQESSQLVAAAAAESWPSFNCIAARRGTATTTSSSSPSSFVHFAPLFGWETQHVAVTKFQKFIKLQFLLPVLSSTGSSSHEMVPEHVIVTSGSDSMSETEINARLEMVSTALGIDSFAPFLLHLAGVLLVRGEAEAKSFIVDAPVSVDQWLGRRPALSYPVPSLESDHFFIVADVASRLVQWMHTTNDAALSKLFVCDPPLSADDPESRGQKYEIEHNLAGKLRGFAFTKERLPHVVFALTLLAEATRANRRAMATWTKKNPPAAQGVEWCWIDAAMCDALQRGAHDDCVAEYLSMPTDNNKDQRRKEFFEIVGIEFPKRETNNNSGAARPCFGTFFASTWGTLHLSLMFPRRKSSNSSSRGSNLNDDEDVEDGDALVPIWFGGEKFDKELAAGKLVRPDRYRHPGFYGELDQ